MSMVLADRNMGREGTRGRACEIGQEARRGEWRMRLKRFRASGISVVAFCARENVSVASYYHWTRLLRDKVTGSSMGRKAWLFVSSVESGEQSTQLMSVVSSAKRHDLDVWTYVKDVLDQLLAGTTDYEQLLSDVWNRSHPEAVRVFREEERRDKAERKQYEAAQRRLAKAAQRDQGDEREDESASGSAPSSPTTSG